MYLRGAYIMGKTSRKNEMIIAGYAAIFNDFSANNDLILKGSFLYFIKNAENNIKLVCCYGKKEPIGKITKIFEDEKGLYIEGVITADTRQSREAIELINKGIIDSLGVRYTIIDDNKSQNDSTKITNLQLHEICLLTSSTNYNTRISVINKNQVDCKPLYVAVSNSVVYDTNSSDFFLDKGIELHDTNKFLEAIESYDKATFLDPQNDDAYYNKGLVLRALKKYKEAIWSFNQAIRIKPYRADLYYNKGDVLLRLNKNHEAIAAFDKAISLDPYNADTYIAKGHALVNLNIAKEAIEAYDNSIRLNPAADVYYSKGIVLYKLHKLEEAYDAFEKAMSVKPDYVPAYIFKGIVLRDLNKFPEAIDACDKAILLEPEYPLTYCNKGKLLETMGDYQGALECFNKAYQTYKRGNCRTSLSSDNIEYINKILSEDRNTMISKILKNKIAKLDAPLGNQTDLNIMLSNLKENLTRMQETNRYLRLQLEQYDHSS